MKPFKKEYEWSDFKVDMLRWESDFLLVSGVV